MSNNRVPALAALVLLAHPFLFAQAARTALVDLYGDPLPKGAVARLGTVRFQHEGPIHDLAFVDDGKKILTVCPAGLRWWDVETGRELRRIKVAIRGSACLSPDRKTIAVLGDYGSLILLDTATGDEKARLEGNKGQAGGLTWSPDNRCIAVAQGNCAVFVWEASSGELLRELTRGESALRGVAFSADGKTLAVAGHSYFLWKWRTDDAPRPLEGKPHPWGYKDILFSPNGKMVAARFDEQAGKGSFYSLLRLWDGSSGKRLLDCEKGYSATALAFSSDSKLLAGSVDEYVRVWDTTSGTVRKKWICGAVKALAFSSDGKRLASGGSDGRLRLWDVATGTELWPTRGHVGLAQVLAFSPEGRILASGGADRTIRSWDWRSGREVRSCKLSGMDREYPLQGIWYTPDGKNLLSAEWKSEAEKTAFSLWDCRSATVLSQYDLPSFAWAAGPAHEKNCFWLAHSEDIVFVDLRHGKETGRLGRYSYRRNPKTLQAYLEASGAKAARPKVLFSSAAHVPKSLWHWEDPDQLRNVFRFSPSGRLLACVHHNSIYVREMPDERRAYSFDVGDADVLDVAFHPQELVMATALSDGAILIWDLTGGLLDRGRLRPLKLDPADIDDQWRILKATPKPAPGELVADATAAQRAIWRLAATPASIPLLKEHLRPIPRALAEHLEQCLRDLGSDSYSQREKASQELEKLGDKAALALRRVLDSKPPLEVHRRAEALLKKMNEEELALQWLRTIRALAVLEHAQSDEAHRLLEELADGAPEEPLTQVARAILERRARAIQKD